MTSVPRVRFAPSPTGHVHIGNIRVAIFNWLYARHTGGAFLLRIEDTDLERSTPEAVATLLEAMRWLGLDHDEEALYQSGEAGRHRAAADAMVARGVASRAPGGPTVLHLDANLYDPSFVTEPRDDAEIDVTKGELLASPRALDYVTVGGDGKEYHTPYAWDALSDLVVHFEDGAREDGAALRARLAPAEGAPAKVVSASGARAARLAFRRRYVFFDDLVLGRREKPLESLRDLVIVRSDGSPVFHLANVIDDVTQNVTHVLRGNDHVENTFRHLFLYHALGRPRPAYGHFPMIVNAKGKPYSKRDGDAYVGDFRAKGYLPEALFNFLALCGWGRDGDEIMSREEMVGLFTLDRVSASPSQMNLEKLEWMNGQYLARCPAETLAPLVKDELARAGVAADRLDPAWLAALVELERERLKTVADFVGNTRFFFAEPEGYDDKAVKKFLLKNDGAGLAMLEALREPLAAVGPWTAAAIESAAVAVGEARGMQNQGELAQPLRVAMTGGGVSRGIWETLALLGRDRVLARLDRALAAFKDA